MLGRQGREGGVRQLISATPLKRAWTLGFLCRSCQRGLMMPDPIFRHNHGAGSIRQAIVLSPSWDQQCLVER